MGKINVLSFDVANLIAAGEVVDRPASVVKELMENALDAGATSITVEIQNGGVSFIRVSDNGCGMEAEDLPVAVLRHATSKIREATDLDGIATLGFRGEALAAISAVSRVRIFSKVAGAEFGALLACDGGSVVSVTETGCAPGTTVIVEELFFNVPARRKFLKKNSTESVAVTGVVEKIALSKPEVSIRYIIDGDVKFMTAGDGELRNTVYALYGRDTADRMLAVDRTDGGIRVWGFISDADSVRSNRNMENFFINGRYVKSRTAAAALEQAYVSRIPAEKFPFCVLNIELNPAAVDVNVHPAKLEVKFSNEKIIFDVVYYAVKSALEATSARPELTIAQPKKPNTPQGKGGVSANPFWVSDKEASKLLSTFIAKGEPTPNAVRSQIRLNTPGMQAAATPVREEKKQDAAVPAPVREEKPLQPAPVENLPVTPPPVSPITYETAAPIPPAKPQAAPAPAPVPEAPEAAEAPEIPDYVIIGEAYNCYVIVQLEDRLILIDKHAAHERILFDQLCENMRGSKKSAQVLMFSIPVSMTEAEIQALEDHREQIESIGFAFKRDASGVQITEIPTEITREAAPEMLAVLAGRIADGTGTVESTGAEYFEARLYQASCKAAIKGGRLYTGDSIKWICDRILCVPKDGSSAIKTCPHGRPVAFEIRKNSIERQFSRLL
jgi:DNA mismatch repair protein MutL